MPALPPPAAALAPSTAAQHPAVSRFAQQQLQTAAGPCFAAADAGDSNAGSAHQLCGLVAAAETAHCCAGFAAASAADLVQLAAAAAAAAAGFVPPPASAVALQLPNHAAHRKLCSLLNEHDSHSGYKT